MPVSLSMYQQATWKEETHLICARGRLMQFHARVTHLRIKRDVGEKHIGSHGAVAEAPAWHVATMVCMSCSSRERRPCDKHQQAHQMSRRPCPPHAPHSASRLLHVTLRVRKDPACQTCSSKILYNSNSVAMPCARETGRSWRDNVRVEHRESSKRDVPSHRKVACPLRTRTQARVKRKGYMSVAARVCGQKRRTAFEHLALS